MYDAFLGLNHRPFVAVPDVERYFPAAAIENARKTLARSLDRGEGVGLLMGPAGAGKTLLLAVLAAQFHEKYAVAMLASGRLSTRRAMFQTILHELRRPYRGMDEGELRLALSDYLLDADRCPHGMLVLVDEAHTLSTGVLDEIRMLTNLARRGTPLVRLILAGSLALEERFASPRLESFNQRIVARCYLEALTRAETVEYVQSRIDAAGGKGKALFPAEACQSVFKATDGVPRLVNQVCDHAIVLACVRAVKQIDAALIDEAWADLQQLPTPWNETPAAAAGESEGLIEFGSLDDLQEPAAPHAHEIEAAEPSSVFEFGELEEPSASDGGRASPCLDVPTASPEEQVEQIEQMLCEVEGQGVDPASVVRFADSFDDAADADAWEIDAVDERVPEVDLIFDEADHPFLEAFEEEELVSDRYVGRKCAAPCVSVFDRMVTPTAVAVAPMALPPKLLAAQASPTSQNTAQPPAMAQPPNSRESARPTASEAARQADAPVEAEGEADRAVVMPITQTVLQREEDEGVLVVESDYDENAVEPTTYKMAPVRRQEYSQLFARLRRKSV